MGCGGPKVPLLICPSCGSPTGPLKLSQHVSVLPGVKIPEEIDHRFLLLSRDLTEAIDSVMCSLQTDQNGLYTVTHPDMQAVQTANDLTPEQTEFLTELVSYACESHNSGIVAGTEFRRKAKHG